VQYSEDPCRNLFSFFLQEGYGEFQVCQERGVRADAHRQYLKPVSGRSNLTVVTHARTLGVNLEDGRGETVARGVTFTTGGADGEKHSGVAICFAVEGVPKLDENTSGWITHLGQASAGPANTVNTPLSRVPISGKSLLASHCSGDRFPPTQIVTFKRSFPLLLAENKIQPESSALRRSHPHFGGFCAAIEGDADASCYLYAF